jgi:hypothetical protein
MRRPPAGVHAVAGRRDYVDDRYLPFAAIETGEIFNDFYRPIGVARGVALMPFNTSPR